VLEGGQLINARLEVPTVEGGHGRAQGRQQRLLVPAVEAGCIHQQQQLADGGGGGDDREADLGRVGVVAIAHHELHGVRADGELVGGECAGGQHVGLTV